MCMRVHMLLYPSLCSALLDLQRLSPPSTLIKSRSEGQIQKKTSFSPELLSFEGLSASFPLRQPGVTLFPCSKGKVTFPNADGNPVTIMDRLMGRAGEVSIPLPHFHTQPSSPSANPPCSLSSSHHPVQQEPRFLSPGLLHGQRTALPTKPPGRPITKLYTVHVLSHFNFKDTLAQVCGNLVSNRVTQNCTSDALVHIYMGAECFSHIFFKVSIQINMFT